MMARASQGISHICASAKGRRMLVLRCKNDDVEVHLLWVIWRSYKVDRKLANSPRLAYNVVSGTVKKCAAVHGYCALVVFNAVVES